MNDINANNNKLTDGNTIQNERHVLTECDFAQNNFTNVQNNFALAQNERRALTEHDFYPPYDDRFHHLEIDNIPNGDTYENYLIEFWELYEEELYN